MKRKEVKRFGFWFWLPPPLRGGFVFVVIPRVTRRLWRRFNRGYRPAPLRGWGKLRGMKEVGIQKWEVGSGKWEVGSGEWEREWEGVSYAML